MRTRHRRRDRDATERTHPATSRAKGTLIEAEVTAVIDRADLRPDDDNTT
jgi:hypothetical protein